QHQEGSPAPLVWLFISGTARSSRYWVRLSLLFCRHSGDASVAVRPEGCVTISRDSATGVNVVEVPANRVGMVKEVQKGCGNEGCSKQPSYGVAESREAEFCADHARAGMVNVVSKKCGNEGCSKTPSYGIAGSR
ncbi:unnamed protein product, partial [Sphacelaria rigidula]